MKRFVHVIIPLLILFFLIAPALVLAQEGPLVPCGADDNQCQFCHLIELIQRVINFIIWIAAPVATLLIAWAGIRLMVYGESDTERGKAKQLLWDILIGFLWILFAWTIVNLILNTLVSDKVAKDTSSWFSIKCAKGPALNLDFTIVGDTRVQVLGPVRPEDCPTCTTLPSSINTNGNSCAGETGGGGRCQVSSSLVVPLQAAWQGFSTAGIQMSASETWPPTVVHKDSCHYNGTCIDASLAESQRTGTNILKAQEIYSNSNLRGQYEVPTEARKQELQKQGVTDIIIVAGVSEHFSVYQKGYKP